MKVQTGVKSMPVIALLAAMFSLLGVGAEFDNTWTRVYPQRRGATYTIQTSGKYYLGRDLGGLAVSSPNETPIEVTVDLNGYAVSNATDTCLVDIAQNGPTTLTLTNSSETVSYVDGCFHEVPAGYDLLGRGICNWPKGTVRFGGNITIRRCFTHSGGAGIVNMGTFYMSGGNVGEAASTNETGFCILGCDTAFGSRSDHYYRYGAGVLNLGPKNKAEYVGFFEMTGGSVCYCLNRGGNGPVTTPGHGVGIGLAGGNNMLIIYGGSIVSNTAAALGGGIYLGKGLDEEHLTTLNCPASERSGIVGAYSNVADRAGNEIVSAGALTKVILPNRELKDGEGRSLYWFEDYYTDDTHYAERWEGAPEGTTVGMRYRDAATMGMQQRVTEETAQDGSPYLCLTLGYVVHMPKGLWITDHADAGPGKVHLAFQPIAEDTLDMATWIPYAQRNDLVRFATADTEAALTNTVVTPLRNDFTFRDGTGTQDVAKGWCWITIPSTETNKLYKIVICNKEQDE